MTSSEQSNCEWAPRHLPVVTVSRRLLDFFRPRYWVRCWTCDLARGPYDDPEAARTEANRLEGLCRECGELPADDGHPDCFRCSALGGPPDGVSDYCSGCGVKFEHIKAVLCTKCLGYVEEECGS